MGIAAGVLPRSARRIRLLDMFGRSGCPLPLRRLSSSADLDLADTEMQVGGGTTVRATAGSRMGRDFAGRASKGLRRKRHLGPLQRCRHADFQTGLVDAAGEKKPALDRLNVPRKYLRESGETLIA